MSLLRLSVPVPLLPAFLVLLLLLLLPPPAAPVRIRTLPAFLPPTSAENLIRLFAPRLPAGPGQFTRSAYLRLPRDARHPALRRVAALAAAALGVPLVKLEPVSLTQYTAGQHYGLHHDAAAVRRTATLLVYLSAPQKTEGGGSSGNGGGGGGSGTTGNNLDEGSSSNSSGGGGGGGSGRRTGNNTRTAPTTNSTTTATHTLENIATTTTTSPAITSPATPAAGHPPPHRRSTPSYSYSYSYTGGETVFAHIPRIALHPPLDDAHGAPPTAGGGTDTAIDIAVDIAVDGGAIGIGRATRGDTTGRWPHGHATLAEACADPHVLAVAPDAPGDAVTWTNMRRVAGTEEGTGETGEIGEVGETGEGTGEETGKVTGEETGETGEEAEGEMGVDESARHGSCPVGQGTKWVLQVWADVEDNGFWVLDAGSPVNAGPDAVDDAALEGESVEQACAGGRRETRGGKGSGGLGGGRGEALCDSELRGPLTPHAAAAAAAAAATVIVPEPPPASNVIML